MKHYEKKMTEMTALASVTCDLCGISEEDERRRGGLLHLAEVIISVEDGEEGGKVDMFDLCETCLNSRAAALIEAGSTAPILTGEEL